MSTSPGSPQRKPASNKAQPGPSPEWFAEAGAPAAKPTVPPASTPKTRPSRSVTRSQSAVSWPVWACVGLALLAVPAAGIAVTVAMMLVLKPTDEAALAEAPVPEAAPITVAASKPVPEQAGPLPCPPDPVPEEFVGPPAPDEEEATPTPPLVMEKVGPEPEMPVVEEKPMPGRDPKPLSQNVKDGLDYLAKNQLPNGGWRAAGTVRIGGKGMGGFPAAGNPQTQEPADLGATCIATLAFLRAGNTAKEGPYAKNVAKAIEFILYKVERSDSRSLMTSDLKSTQLQHKIGPYVDTFLALLVLAELKGQSGNERTEQRVWQALHKTINKVEGNLKQDGTFANNNGWASVLSQGLAMKGLNRARQVGARVSDSALERLQKHALAELELKLNPPATGRPVGRGKDSGSLRTPGSLGSDLAPTDAGVSLYSLSANLAGLREAVTTNILRETKARAILVDETAAPIAKDRARSEIAKLESSRKALDKAVDAVSRQGQDPKFVRGFGSNGGEEYLSFMNISETLLLKGGDDWSKWDKTMTGSLESAQDREGSWSGHHCITGKTFCTSVALLVLLADRVPVVSSAKAPAAK